MKFLIKFLLICLLIFPTFQTSEHRRKSKILKDKMSSSKPKKLVGLYFYDATNSKPKEQNIEKKQYFEFFRKMKKHEFNYDEDPDITSKTLSSEIPAFECSTDFDMKFVKIYYRSAGKLLKTDMRKEINKALEIPTAKPNTEKAFFYLSGVPEKFISLVNIIKPIIPAANVLGQNLLLSQQNVQNNHLFEAVEHEILEICGTCQNNKEKVQRLFIDRDAFGKDKKKLMWHSRVRVSVVPATSCTAKEWGNDNTIYLKNRDGMDEITPISIGKSSFNAFLYNIKNYLKRYWRYNAIYNCQHFATNFFNEITTNHFDFKSAMLIGRHALKSEYEPKLEFQLNGVHLCRDAKDPTYKVGIINFDDNDEEIDEADD